VWLAAAVECSACGRVSAVGGTSIVGGGQFVCWADFVRLLDGLQLLLSEEKDKERPANVEDDDDGHLIYNISDVIRQRCQ